LSIGIAGFTQLRSGRASWNDPLALTWTAAIVTYPAYSGPVRGPRWATALGVAVLGSGSAVVLTLASGNEPLAPLRLPLAWPSALARGAVAGSVGLATVLGHWYLTVPNLSIEHLRRLNRVAMACLLACLVIVLATLGVFRDRLGQDGDRLLGPTGLFYLG